MLRPNSETLNQKKYVQDGISFWKTIDFFPYDEDKAEQLRGLLASAPSFLAENKDFPQATEIAQELELTVESLRQQLENYAKVTQTPYCLWKEDVDSSEFKPIFFESVDAIAEYQKTDRQTITTFSEQSPSESNLDKFFKITKRLTPWIWATVLIVVVIPTIGQWLMARSMSADVPPPAIVETVPSDGDISSAGLAIPDWDKLRDITKEKMRRAQSKVEILATQELDDWVDDLTQRLDNSFLDWYFGYFHQKQLQYQSFFAGISGQLGKWLDPSNPSPQEKIAEEITADFQEEFAKRVLVPQISEFQLQNITVKVAKAYIRELGQEFNQIPLEQGISAAEWDRYLKDTAITIPDTVGNPLQLPLKQMTTVGAYIAFKPLIMPMLPKVGSAVAGKMAAKVGGKIATKTGGILAAKLGSTFLDATVGVGILMWDIWDTHHTANVEKPILRQNLVDYIAQIEESVLSNPDNGVMAITKKINDKIFGAIDIAQDMVQPPTQAHS